MKKISKPPKRYQNVKKRFPKVVDAYENFGDALAGAGPLSPRERALVKLGIAAGAGLESAVHSHALRPQLPGGGSRAAPPHSASYHSPLMSPLRTPWRIILRNSPSDALTG